MKVYIYRREGELYLHLLKYVVFITRNDLSLSKLFYIDLMPKKKLTRKFIRSITGKYTKDMKNLGVPLYTSANGSVKNILITKYEI